jgi:hypothetical protein
MENRWPATHVQRSCPWWTPMCIKTLKNRLRPSPIRSSLIVLTLVTIMSGINGLGYNDVYCVHAVMNALPHVSCPS